MDQTRYFAAECQQQKMIARSFSSVVRKRKKAEREGIDSENVLDAEYVTNSLADFVVICNL